MRVSRSLIGTLACCAVLVSNASAARDDLVLVSRAAGADGKGANAGSYQMAISADGRYVALASEATNLDPDDRYHDMDVYLRDMQTNRVRLVDRAAGRDGAGANAPAAGPSISGDGRYVAFDSCATNLVAADDHKHACDVFVRDLRANTTTLVSRAGGAAGKTGDGDSEQPSISGDGRYVAFLSEAANLAPGDRDDVNDVYVRDLKARKTILVTRSRYEVKKSGRVESVVISGDGRVVAFVTARPDLVQRPHPTIEGTDSVLVRDLDGGKLELVSRATGPGGAAANELAATPSLSADGRFVAFDTLATNIGPPDDAVHSYGEVFVRDRTMDTTVPVTVYAPQPEESLDVSDAEAQAISGDGRYVVFNSDAPALHPGLPSAFAANPDIFVRDMKTGTVTLVSRASGAAGAPGNNGALFAVMSDDGRFVAFSSVSENLDPDAVGWMDNLDPETDDDISGPDVYRRDVLGAPGAPVPGPGARNGCPMGGTPIAGTAGDDVRTGSNAGEVISGRRGDDVLRGGGGRDCVYGDAGRDRVSGGHGSDRLFGGSGADRADGGPGRDVVIGGSGGDRLVGGSGADRLADHSGRDRFSGGAGNDRIDARDRTRRGRRGPDIVRCGAGRHDVALVDAADHVAGDCERVRRR